METIPLELRKLGLKEKEVRVYLAGLALGPSSAQIIAERTGIPRPTAYEVLENLIQKGLFIETQQQKKRSFIAQSPERILGLLRLQKRELEEREREFIRIIAALEAQYAKTAGDAGIEMFKGKEGVTALLERFSFSSTPDIIVISSKPAGKALKGKEHILQTMRKRLGRIDLKELHSPALKGTLLLFDQAIFLPSSAPSTPLGATAGKPSQEKGYLISHPLIVSLLKSLAPLQT